MIRSWWAWARHAGGDAPASGRLARSVPWLLLLAALAVLVVDAGVVLRGFGFVYTDEDQVLMWYAAREYAAGRVHEPFFFGQNYGVMAEAALAVPLLWARVPPPHALPIAALVLGELPWLLLAGLAWRSRRPVAAALLLLAPLAAPLPYAMLLSLPRAFTGGIALATLGFVLAWRAPERLGRVALLGFCATAGVVMNPNTGLLAVTVCAAVLARPPRWNERARALVALALGAAPAWGLGRLAASFYTLHPGYALHRQWRWGWQRVDAQWGALHIDRYLGFFTPPGLSPLLLLGVLLLGAGVLAARRRRDAAAAGAALVATCLVGLGVNKVHDGGLSVFWPAARSFLAWPVALGALALVALPPLGERRAVRPWLAALVVGAGMLVVTARALDLPQAVERTLLERRSGLAVRTVGALEATCARLAFLARSYQTNLVAVPFDRVAAYGCSALHHDAFETIYPGYDRRTFVLEAESLTRRGRLLVAGADTSVCRAAGTQAKMCAVFGGEPQVVVLLFDKPRSAITVLHDVGYKVRSF